MCIRDRLLGYLFKYQTWWLVCLVLLGMCIAATQIATGRTNKVVRGPVSYTHLDVYKRQR